MYRSVRAWGLSMVLTLTCMLAFSCSDNSTGGDVDDDEDNDGLAPSAIVDLRVAAVNTNSALLRWTAPGDDGSTGCAYEYDLRGSTDSITAANFLSAIQATEVDPPLPAGMTQEYTVDGLQSGQKYYFAIKTRDVAGNWSGLSNCLSLTCLVDEVVVFADTALVRVVRDTIGLATGDIHFSDVQNITDFGATDLTIEDLTGLEYFVSVHFLFLYGNNISDLTPLADLDEIFALGLADNNISDLSPLAGMTGLRQLIAGENPISDITPLANMSYLGWLRLNSTDVTDFTTLYGLDSLTELDLGSNQLGDVSFAANLTQVKTLILNGDNISDVTALGSLTGLEILNLVFNRIADITPLSGLTGIRELNLRYNEIVDIEPLVNNPGLDSGDVVFLQNNPLSEESVNEHIPALEARDVTVYH
ncbi:MAG: leucine-rich repeat domain-containing protein [Candidatus Zixiibacteriota bacterium]